MHRHMCNVNLYSIKIKMSASEYHLIALPNIILIHGYTKSFPRKTAAFSPDPLSYICLAIPKLMSGLGTSVKKCPN